ncbi:hypothetical protein BJ138DRAFT_1116184 [Hygrophoropsis aurantiaca]|uniref:Uncharacterized protein n=1 Tax=Hygrophoropsis aurantiaca TaxID=72124 RepID=A0ACB8A5M0_9AGAM|nr:hypothetical protein BJ138DRAFT_1116184 [Hygrophoropsis aurantiaca]
MSQSVIVISSEAGMDTFLTKIRSNAAVAVAVRSLHVTSSHRTLSIPTLRECLRRLKFLEDLELTLCGVSGAGWGQLLRGIRFRHLELLYTNASHAALTAFIHHHPTIVYLKIDQCMPGLSSCPLKAAALPALSDIAAPASCVSSIVDGNPVARVLATQLTDRDVRLPSVTLLASLASSSVAIDVLQIDIDPTNFDILDRIAKAAPYISALNLIEKDQPSFRAYPRGRRAWKDTRSWAKGLKRLTQLNTLSLRTSTPLTAIPGNEVQEAIVVRRWSGLIFANNRPAPASNSHPTLRHIQLQYVDNGVNYQSQWDRDRIAWFRTIASVSEEGDIVDVMSD